MEDAYWVGLGLTRRIYTYRHYFDLELEGQVNKFFGDQDNWEFDFFGYIRWLPFPWDRYLDTSFAAGAGLSYATSVPEIEVKNQGESAQFLGALSFEFTFALPVLHNGILSPAFITVPVRAAHSAGCAPLPTG